MRKSDKKKNFLKVNLLSEQRYLQSKGIITESFNDVDVAPISLGGDQMTVKEDFNEMDLESNPQLLDNIISQISDIVAPYIGINIADKAVANHNWEVILTAFNQRFSRNSKYKDEFGKEYTKPMTEEEEIGDDFWDIYNTSAQEQKQICWNMIQHFKDFDAAMIENQKMLRNAIDKGSEDEAKILRFRLQYMENNRDMLDTPENPFFNK